MKIADPLLMREINKYHVLETIRCHGRISRVEISERTLLSGTTVSAITGALIEEGLIAAMHVQRTGEGTRGRPRVLLDLIADAAYVVGVKISLSKVTTSVSNFKGEAVYSVQRPLPPVNWNIHAVIDAIEACVDHCVSVLGIDRKKIRGVGIGLPEPASFASDSLSADPFFGSGAAQLALSLEKSLKLQVKAARPAELVALAESWFGYAQSIQSFAAITVDQKVSLALWIDGNLHKGASALGTGFGHLKVGCEGWVCECGQVDCLNAYMSTTGQVAGTYGGLPAAETLPRLCAMALSGDEQASDLFANQGKMLGIAVSHMINLVNPERIIVVTDDPLHNDLIEATFRQSVQQNSCATQYQATNIIFRTNDEQLLARGAAALMLRDIYGAPWNADSMEA